MDRHLVLYAQASADPDAVLLAARRFASGTPVAEPDLVLAVDWYHCAVALDSPEAALELQALWEQVT